MSTIQHNYWRRSKIDTFSGFQYRRKITHLPIESKLYVNAILQVLKNMPSVLEKSEGQNLLNADISVEQSTSAVLVELKVEESSTASVSSEDNSPEARAPDDPLPNVWVYDRQAYDLSDFIKKHPGGEFFIGRMKNRDITALVNVLHSNPTKIKRRLQKYSLNRAATDDDLHPKYNAPPFCSKTTLMPDKIPQSLTSRERANC